MKRNGKNKTKTKMKKIEKDKLNSEDKQESKE